MKARSYPGEIIQISSTEIGRTRCEARDENTVAVAVVDLDCVYTTGEMCNIDTEDDGDDIMITGNIYALMPDDRPLGRCVAGDATDA